MGHKVFVSYKYGDTKVQPISELTNSMADLASVFASLNMMNKPTTARDYVNKIIGIMGDSANIYKGEEDGNDLSSFCDDTIATKLKERIKDSSVTVILISKGMKTADSENDQWIPWEISYSLKEISSGGRTSRPNGLLAVVLPDENGSYDYYLEECPHCNTRTHKRSELFQILGNNMFNLKAKNQYDSGCFNRHGKVHSGNNHSYVHQVKWIDFIGNHEYYINYAAGLRDSIGDYDIQKVIIK